MVDEKYILIGDKILTKKELFQQQEELQKQRAKLPFEEKIKILVELQKLAKTWGNRKDVIVWKI